MADRHRTTALLQNAGWAPPVQPLAAWASMDAFERLVASLLERDGYWVRSSYRVILSKEEKREIGRPSAPRWELDLIAYKGATNELRMVECKSYLDSRGVSAAAFDGRNAQFAARFKLFTDDVLRRVVTQRLVAQLAMTGTIRPRPAVTLCLAAGRIASEGDRAALRTHFDRSGWLLWDDEWLGQELQHLSRGGYENDIASVVAKLLLRARRPKASRSDG